MSQLKVAKAILGLFFCTSLLWSIFTPVFEGPDEDSAYNYARYYARTWELPNITKKPVSEGAFHWEPLYFMLAGRIAAFTNAPASKSGDYYYMDGWQRIREENPVNLFKHKVSEFRFNWDRIAWSLHLMRLTSVFLATASVWLTYKFSQEIFPKPSWIPHITMLFFAFNPQFIFFSGILNLVNMVIFTTSAFLYLLARYIHRVENYWYHSAGLGAALGVAIISKMTALMMLPVALATVGLRQKEIKKSVMAILIFLFAFLVTGGWYLIRNQALYGEFSGAKAHVLFRFDRPTNPFLEEVGILNYLISYPKTQWITLWSGFGWLTIYLPLVFPFIMLLIYAHGIFGFIQGVLFNKLKLDKIQRRQMIAIGSMPLLAWLGITRAIFYVEVFHGKDLFFVTGALALTVVVGWQNLLKSIKTDNWIGVRSKAVVTGLVGLLTAFWFRQFEMAKLAKGIAVWGDIRQLIFMVAIGMGMIRVSWCLIVHRQSAIKLRADWISRVNTLFTVVAATLMVISLSILFLLFVPKMYSLSLWQLLIQ